MFNYFQALLLIVSFAVVYQSEAACGGTSAKSLQSSQNKNGHSTKSTTGKNIGDSTVKKYDNIRYWSPERNVWPKQLKKIRYVVDNSFDNPKYSKEDEQEISRQLRQEKTKTLLGKGDPKLITQNDKAMEIVGLKETDKDYGNKNQDRVNSVENNLDGQESLNKQEYKIQKLDDASNNGAGLLQLENSNNYKEHQREETQIESKIHEGERDQPILEEIEEKQQQPPAKNIADQKFCLVPDYYERLEEMFKPPGKEYSKPDPNKQKQAIFKMDHRARKKYNLEKAKVFESFEKNDLESDEETMNVKDKEMKGYPEKKPTADSKMVKLRPEESEKQEKLSQTQYTKNSGNILGQSFYGDKEADLESFERDKVLQLNEVAATKDYEVQTPQEKSEFEYLEDESHMKPKKEEANEFKNLVNRIEKIYKLLNNPDENGKTYNIFNGSSQDNDQPPRNVHVSESLKQYDKKDGKDPQNNSQKVSPNLPRLPENKNRVLGINKKMGEERNTNEFLNPLKETAEGEEDKNLKSRSHKNYKIGKKVTPANEDEAFLGKIEKEDQNKLNKETNIPEEISAKVLGSFSDKKNPSVDFAPEDSNSKNRNSLKGSKTGVLRQNDQKKLDYQIQPENSRAAEPNLAHPTFNEYQRKYYEAQIQTDRRLPKLAESYAEISNPQTEREISRKVASTFPNGEKYKIGLKNAGKSGENFIKDKTILSRKPFTEIGKQNADFNGEGKLNAENTQEKYQFNEKLGSVSKESMDGFLHAITTNRDGMETVNKTFTDALRSTDDFEGFGIVEAKGYGREYFQKHSELNNKLTDISGSLLGNFNENKEGFEAKTNDQFSRDSQLNPSERTKNLKSFTSAEIEDLIRDLATLKRNREPENLIAAPAGRLSNVVDSVNKSQELDSSTKFETNSSLRETGNLLSTLHSERRPDITENGFFDLKIPEKMVNNGGWQETDNGLLEKGRNEKLPQQVTSNTNPNECGDIFRCLAKVGQSFIEPVNEKYPSAEKNIDARESFVGSALHTIPPPFNYATARDGSGTDPSFNPERVPSERISAAVHPEKILHGEVLPRRGGSDSVNDHLFYGLLTSIIETAQDMTKERLKNQKKDKFHLPVKETNEHSVRPAKPTLDKYQNISTPYNSKNVSTLQISPDLNKFKIENNSENSNSNLKGIERKEAPKPKKIQNLEYNNKRQSSVPYKSIPNKASAPVRAKSSASQKDNFKSLKKPFQTYEKSKDQLKRKNTKKYGAKNSKLGSYKKVSFQPIGMKNPRPKVQSNSNSKKSNSQLTPSKKVRQGVITSNQNTKRLESEKASSKPEVKNTGKQQNKSAEKAKPEGQMLNVYSSQPAKITRKSDSRDPVKVAKASGDAVTLKKSEKALKNTYAQGKEDSTTMKPNLEKSSNFSFSHLSPGSKQNNFK